jgi:predicted  nucleic acid-binding Zn-ribbon protein
MRKFTCIETGKIYESDNEYWLESCPECKSKKPLYWNGYEFDVSSEDSSDSVSFDLKVQYCSICEKYFIHLI